MIYASTIFILLNFFVFIPVLYVFLSRLFSNKQLTYIESLTLCIQIGVIALIAQAIQLAITSYLPPLFSLLTIPISIGIIVLIISIIKSKFETTIPKAIFIQFLSVVVAISITMTFRYFICQAYKIPAGSNIPTIMVGDHLLVNKYKYRFNSPERGDFIIFKFPKNEKIDYLKRVIGLPNDKFEIRDKKILINGKQLTENYIVNIDNTIKNKEESPRDNIGPITIPQDSYFVLGDNRDNSFDSRFFGPIKKDKIKGKAELIYFSYDKEEKTIRTDRIGMEIE